MGLWGKEDVSFPGCEVGGRMWVGLGCLVWLEGFWNQEK